MSHGNVVRTILKVVGLAPFVWNQFDDTAYTRQLFLFAFTLTQPLIAAVNLVMYQNVLIDNVAFGDTLCWLSKSWITTMGGDKEFEEQANEC